jgi:hypothetical protein
MVLQYGLHPGGWITRLQAAILLSAHVLQCLKPPRILRSLKYGSSVLAVKTGYLPRKFPESLKYSEQDIIIKLELSPLNPCFYFPLNLQSSIDG